MVNGRTQSLNPFDIKLGGVSLKQTNSVKYLGVTIDNKLNWKPHIESLEKKLSTACALICKLRYLVDRKCLVQYYYAHVYSHLSRYILQYYDRSE